MIKTCSVSLLCLSLRLGSWSSVYAEHSALRLHLWVVSYHHFLLSIFAPQALTCETLISTEGFILSITQSFLMKTLAMCSVFTFSCSHMTWTLSSSLEESVTCCALYRGSAQAWMWLWNLAFLVTWCVTSRHAIPMSGYITDIKEVR